MFHNIPAFELGNRQAFWAAVGVVCAVFLYGHYAGALPSGFVMEDWNNVYAAQAGSAEGSTLGAHAFESPRPLGQWFVLQGILTLGFEPLPYALLALLGYAVCLILLAALVYQLTGRTATVLMAGICFALWPNINEPYHQCSLILVNGALSLPLALGSLLCWVLYVRRNRLGWGLASALCYGFGLFAHEAAALLLLAYPLLLDRKEWKRHLPVALVFGGFVALMVGYQLTGNFGRGAEGFSLGVVWDHFKQLISWWSLDKFWSCFMNGFDAFHLHTPLTRRLLVLGSMLLALLSMGLYIRLRRRAGETDAEYNPPLPEWKMLMFSLALAGAGCVHVLLGSAAARSNLYPGVGLALGVAILLSRIHSRRWVSLVAVAMVSCSIANQGTAIAWREAGLAHARLQEYLSAHQAEWEAAEVLLFDTSALRARHTIGLTTADTCDLNQVAFFGNANLFKGQAIKGMLQTILQREQVPAVVLDVECVAQPGAARVYRVDLQEVVSGRAY